MTQTLFRCLALTSVTIDDNLAVFEFERKNHEAVEIVLPLEALAGLEAGVRAAADALAGKEGRDPKRAQA